MNRTRLLFSLKLAASCAILALIYTKFIGRDGAADLLARLGDLSYGWLVAAAAMQFCAISCSLTRWNLLLRGQGIRAPLRHLFGSFMIGRFFGAFTPGGWSGHGGYRIYDIATQTGKTARATATIGTELVLGQLSFGAVVIVGSLFGADVLGLRGVLLVDLFFLSLIVTVIVLLSRPTLFRKLAGLLPAALRPRLQTTVDAVCSYQGKGGLITAAAACGIGTHAFNNLIEVCAARALGVELSVGTVFFVSAMQAFVTLLPTSINGVGVREATAVALYTRLGVPATVAFLIPTLGFAVEMLISAFGGLVFLVRRVGYSVAIAVDDPEREQLAVAQIESAPREQWPRVARGAVIGLAGGVLGGLLLGAGEAAVVLASAAGSRDYSVLAYGSAIYGLACGLAGLGLGVMLAVSGRVIQRAALPEPLAYGRMAALLASAGAFVIGSFRVRRDVFDEQLVWKSPQGLLVLVGCLLAAAIAYFAVANLARLVVERRPFSLLLRVWSSPLLLALLIAANLALSGPRAEAAAAKLSALQKPAAPAAAGNVLVIVVDTLRADHLPLWGYARGKTPNLDAFAKDALRFEHAFANASWTRPSFASIMTGRYPGSHQTTRKSDSLPSEIVTMAEAMQSAGYTTFGVVTNYNVAPFFNFHQGFDEYRYLEPDFVLGAGDTAAKLLFVQLLRQRIEGYRAARGRVEPGSAYQDASLVNRQLLAFLDQQPKQPFHAFAAYMDPHDPYYPHPYDGTGYARAAHQKPDPSEVDTMRALYDGEITFWDEHFGQLVAELKRRKLYDDLTIVITADHGEEFMDHGGFWHGVTLYDEQLHVPLLVKLPQNERGGSVIAHWVESIDLMPSLLRRNGLEVPAGVQGKDLLQPGDQVFAEEDHEGNVLRALRLRRGASELKVIEANPGNPRGLQPYELYRMDQDPKELVNLAREDEQTLGVAVTNLEQSGQQSQQGKVARQQLNVNADPAAVQKLRALGYAGGEDTKLGEK